MPRRSRKPKGPPPQLPPADGVDWEKKAEEMLFSDPSRIRSSSRLLQKVVNAGALSIDHPIYPALVNLIGKRMLDPAVKPYIWTRLCDLLLSFRRDTIAAAVALDKMERLDAGRATENVAIGVTPPHIAALAERMFPDLDDELKPRALPESDQV